MLKCKECELIDKNIVLIGFYKTTCPVPGMKEQVVLADTCTLPAEKAHKIANQMRSVAIDKAGYGRKEENDETDG